MRSLLLLAVLSVVVGGSQGAGTAVAPVPQKPKAPAIEGKYSCVQVVGQADPRLAPGPGGAVPARATRSTLGRTNATITKNEIVFASTGFSSSSSSGFGRTSPYSAIAESTMKYFIDPTKSPMAIDVYTIDFRNKKTKSEGVIEIDDDRVTIALAKPGDARPKSMEEGEGMTVYYFKKSPPPPRAEFRIVAMTAGKEAEAEKALNQLAGEGYDLVSTTQPTATDPKAAVTTIHFVLRRTARE